MKQLGRFVVVIVACATTVLAGCGTDPPDAITELPDPTATSPQPQLTPEEALAHTLLGFQDAVRRQEVPQIVAFFSDRFESNEASGLADVTKWWTNVINSGLAAQLPLDPATATTTINNQVADVAYYDTNGELACRRTANPCQGPQRYLDFRFKHDPEHGWQITGIPSEN